MLGCLSVSVSAQAQTAPSGAHPRIWLDADTLTGMQAQADVANSPVARGAARCEAARLNPSEYDVGGWQGFEFVTTLSGCLGSWVASGNTDDLATAIKYWNVLLDDYQTVGDGLGGDTVVTHDTGYAMRTFAPYSALAYDWLHDAPGVTEALRAHARARFDAWFSYYSTSGYLRDMPGANYQAGYVFAATLIAIAEGGEAGAAGDAHWATVRDSIWSGDMIPALAPGGVLHGGDWPEGWQYGPLSVLEYALAARAMQDSGMPIQGIETWASSLPVRFAHGLTPMTQMTYPAGDSANDTPYRDPTNGALLAAIAGPASADAKSWARQLNADLDLSNENPLFDALAAAANGPSAAIPTDMPTNHLAQGAGNWYMRRAWTPDTVWGVFQCSPQVVADHHHSNAGNWVLTRGADDLVVDPSPYGSLSTLTGNAPAIDSAVLPSGYSPSQGFWGESTQLVWARQSESGVAAGRCDYADQFRRSDVPSDVSHALRDYVMIPHSDGGTVVLIDRAVTDAADRALHLRVRTPSSLSLTGDVATGTLGSSALGIHKVWPTTGTPNVREMPQGSECASSDHTCEMSRIASGSEYRIDVAGPAAFAIHVVNAGPAGAAPSSDTMLSGAGYRGVLVENANGAVAVITNDAIDAVLGSSLAYSVPAGSGAVHVVVDAPVDADGKSDVTSVLEGDDCKVEITPFAGTTEGFEGRPLILRATDNCDLVDEGTQLPMAPSPDDGASDPGTAEGGAPGDGDSDSDDDTTAAQGGTSNDPQAMDPNAPANSGEVGSDGPGQDGNGPTGTILDVAGTNTEGTDTATFDSAQVNATDGGCALSAPRRGGSLAPFALGAIGLWLCRRRRRGQG